MKEVFYRILRAGLWDDEIRPEDFTVSKEVANEVMEMGRLQQVAGMMMEGMNRWCIDLGEDNDRWMRMYVNIEKTNRKIDGLAQRIVNDLRNEGTNAEVFKGGSVAKWYRNPMARTYGDIDVVATKNFGRIEEVLKRKNLKYRREHNDIVCKVEGIMVEFHPMREYAFRDKDNDMLQALVRDFPESKEVYMACLIVHLRRHMLTYGVGMKQVCDVAVMLRYAELDMDFLSEIIRKLHMERFCAALFGFLKRCLKVEVFPIEPDCGKNSLLIEEIVWRDGYLRKKEREKRTKGFNALYRMADNAWFWIRRCVSMSGIMPGEALWFIPYMTKRRFLLFFSRK